MAKNSPARKARLKERARQRRVEEDRLCAAHRRDGASCAKCHHSDRPASMSGRMVCQLDSDFHGYAMTTPINICSRFKARDTE